MATSRCLRSDPSSVVVCSRDMGRGSRSGILTRTARRIGRFAEVTHERTMAVGDPRLLGVVLLEDRVLHLSPQAANDQVFVEAGDRGESAVDRGCGELTC